MNRRTMKKVKKAKKAIRRFMNQPWTNGTYVKLCCWSAIASTVIGALVAGVTYAANAVEEGDRYKRYVEEGCEKVKVPVTEERLEYDYESKIHKENEEA